jgi:seryl-tRNA synthetase
LCAEHAAGAAFRQQLLDAGVLLDGGVPGLYGRSDLYERVVRAVEERMAALAEPGSVEVVRFPPVVARDTFLRSGYLASFPQLTGTLLTFSGSERDHIELLRLSEAGDDWTHKLAPAPVVVQNAACHPVYAQCSGTLPAGGRTFDIYGWCFRNEPSMDPLRMVSFRQYEYVYVGEESEALVRRNRWLDQVERLLLDLHLDVRPAIANDPFFGRPGQLLATSQREAERKIELVVPLYDDHPPTAVASGNTHADHFGSAFGIQMPDGHAASSSCIGLGVDRVALSLFRTHGFDVQRWPDSLRESVVGTAHVPQ